MVEAVMLWNEPNNLSHWDYELDPEWQIYAAMVKQAAEAVAAENPNVRRVMGGISPIEADFIRRMDRYGVLDAVDVVAVHGFPLDWNHWSINEWPDKLGWIQDICELPVWVTEVGVSSFGAEEVQEFGIRRTAELLRGRTERIYWYSLYDVPRTWAVSSRNPEAEGSAYYRHFYMGLLREDGTPKLAVDTFARETPDVGICQWFHFEDHRLDDAVRWLRKLGVKHLRTGLSWADSYRPNALDWFDRQMEALAEFRLTVTFCYTPPSLGVREDCASPPRQIEPFAEFCAAMVRRYAGSAGAGEPRLGAQRLRRGPAPLPASDLATGTVGESVGPQPYLSQTCRSAEEFRMPKPPTCGILPHCCENKPLQPYRAAAHFPEWVEPRRGMGNSGNHANTECNAIAPTGSGSPHTQADVVSSGTRTSEPERGARL